MNSPVWVFSRTAKSLSIPAVQDIRLVIELRVIRTRPRRGSLPLRDLPRLRIEHRQTVAVKYAAPQAVLGVDVASPATRAFRGEVIPNGLQSLAVGDPNLVVR
ncbi:MAG: hypothetical protein DMG13_33095 [Acidobacteria bacterium]|nr:MAG: hypothetical protein DMG13_33095 [Acidobacteriota bacterium]